MKLNPKMVVDKETLGKIIILVDETEKLASKLEDLNQETRILLHSLVYGSSKKPKRFKDRKQELIELAKGPKE